MRTAEAGGNHILKKRRIGVAFVTAGGFQSTYISAFLDRGPAPAEIDEVALRAYRVGRIRAEMAKRDIAAVILGDAVNIRYATGTRNMQVFTARNAPSRYLLLTESESILF